MFNIRKHEFIALTVAAVIFPSLIYAQSSTTPPPSDDYGTGDTTSGIYCPHLSVTLQKGSRDAATGGQVSELQAFLTDYFNLDENIVVGGYFGKLTQQYLISFQNQQSLPAFGIAGSLTRAKIAQVCGVPTPPPTPTGGITVTAPNGGEQWEELVMNTVTWTPYSYDPDVNPAKDVTAYLEVKGGPGGDYTTLGKIEESGKASIHWYTGYLDLASGSANLVPPGQYYVRVVNNVTGAWDRSDSPFTIQSPAIDLKANGMDGGVQLNAGSQKVNLAWTGRDVSGCVINSSKSKTTTNGGVVRYVNLPVDPNGSKTITINPLQTSYINISCTRNADSMWVSDAVYFYSQPSASFVSVGSPNGGENIDPNGSTNIIFGQSSITHMSIALYLNNKWVQWIEKDVPDETIAAGNYTWNINSDTRTIIEHAKALGLEKKFKIYITGEKQDGNGAVDDKSDSTFSFTSGTVTSPSGTLSVSTDVSSPSYQIVAGGSTSVTLGSYKFSATGESIRLEKVGFYLASGSTPTAYPGDIVQLYLYDGSNLVGTAVFAGNSYGAVSTLTSSVTIPRDSSKTITVKADIAAIGTAQAGHSGDLIQIGVLACVPQGCKDGTGYGTGITSGQRINQMGSTELPAGTRIFRSFPTVSAVPMSSTLVSGVQSLIRFSISANSSGPIGLGRLNFNWSLSNVTVDSAAVYAYTDSNFSNPVPGFAGGRVGTLSGAKWLDVIPSNPLQIPAGQTYYFELRGTVALSGTVASITTTLLADANYVQLQQATVLQQKDVYFVWSPNDNSTSSYSDSDWTDSYGVVNLQTSGISQSRSGSGTVTPPVATTTPPTPPTPPAGQKRISLTAGGSWTVPNDWNSSNNTIEVIGGGGGGGTGGSEPSRLGTAAGGGGGAYSKITNYSASAGASVQYSVGAGGSAESSGADTYFSSNTCEGSAVCARGGKSGGAAGNATGGAGGQASSGVGTTKYNGGAGANSGGGGGAAGPNGSGNVGSGGAGGSGDSGSGGAGGAYASTLNATGGNGGNGTEFDSTHGAGGGGGAGNGNSGGNGGSYGAGGAGGGCACAGGVGNAGGRGAQGIIVITYSPVATATYRAYLGGSANPSITTENAPESYALENCKLNAGSNPTKSIRCTWGEKEIYNAGPITVPQTTVTKVETFTSNGSWTAAAGVTSVEYLVVGGGGGGYAQIGGGGGGGGVRTGTLAVTPGTTYSITVGSGGVGGTGGNGSGLGATSGGDSVFGSITATGGGRGGHYDMDGMAGGSGGGAGGGVTTSTSGGAGTPSQGNAGGSGTTHRLAGGGGGAAEAGGNGSGNSAGNGGAGITSKISGSSVVYGGGGGGGTDSVYYQGTPGSGGAGGGGAGSIGTGNGTAGIANSGGGGGGGGNVSNNPAGVGAGFGAGGNGGSGIVIIKYTAPVSASAQSQSNLASVLTAMESIVRSIINKLNSQ